MKGLHCTVCFLSSLLVQFKKAMTYLFWSHIKICRIKSIALIQNINICLLNLLSLLLGYTFLRRAPKTLICYSFLLACLIIKGCGTRLPWEKASPKSTKTLLCLSSLSKNQQQFDTSRVWSCRRRHLLSL